MLGWRKLGRCLDFTLKPSHGCRILRHGRWQHLDRNQPIHAAMLGLEDLAHATCPDLVEDRVLAQDQRFGSASLDLLPLERRQVFAFDECLDEFFDRLGIGLGRDEVFELAGGNDARIGELLDDLFKGQSHWPNLDHRKASFEYSRPQMELQTGRRIAGST